MKILKLYILRKKVILTRAIRQKWCKMRVVILKVRVYTDTQSILI